MLTNTFLDECIIFCYINYVNVHSRRDVIRGTMRCLFFKDWSSHRLMHVHFSNWIYFIFKNEIKSNIFPAFGPYTLHTQKHSYKYYRQNSNSAAYWLFAHASHARKSILMIMSALCRFRRVLPTIHGRRISLRRQHLTSLCSHPFIHCATDAFYCVANAIVLSNLNPAMLIISAISNYTPFHRAVFA